MSSTSPVSHLVGAPDQLPPYEIEDDSAIVTQPILVHGVANESVEYARDKDRAESVKRRGAEFPLHQHSCVPRRDQIVMCCSYCIVTACARVARSRSVRALLRMLNTMHLTLVASRRCPKKTRRGTGRSFSEFWLVIGTIMTCVLAPVFMFFIHSLYKASLKNRCALSAGLGQSSNILAHSTARATATAGLLTSWLVVAGRGTTFYPS